MVGLLRMPLSHMHVKSMYEGCVLHCEAKGAGKELRQALLPRMTHER